jgi:hypothetical protein
MSAERNMVSLVGAMMAAIERVHLRRRLVSGKGGRSVGFMVEDAQLLDDDAALD